MALGIGHINKLFEPGYQAPDLHKVAEQLRAEAVTNSTAALLEALEQDFPELKEQPLKEQRTASKIPRRKAA